MRDGRKNLEYAHHRTSGSLTERNQEGPNLYKPIKALLICASIAFAIVWLTTSSSSHSVQPGQTKPATTFKSEDYVGSDACKDCHEDQFKAFSHTSHAELLKIGSWKSKVTGCKSYRGPGKAHIAECDPTKIIYFKNK